MGQSRDSILTKYWYPIGFAILGAGTPACHNYYVRRPILSGIQKHLAYGIIGGIIGYYADIYMRRKWSERDAVIKHYIELHPEDFVVEKKKYKEIFDEWYPVR